MRLFVILLLSCAAAVLAAQTLSYIGAARWLCGLTGPLAGAVLMFFLLDATKRP